MFVKIYSRFRLACLLLMCLLLGCNSVVDAVAFHPGSSVISKEALPAGVTELIIVAEDKVRLTSLYLRSNQSKKLVLYFHGNAGNIYDRIAALQMLHNAGVSVIGVSYRGYGKSQGEPTEAGVYLDGAAVLDFSVNQLGFTRTIFTFWVAQLEQLLLSIPQ